MLPTISVVYLLTQIPVCFLQETTVLSPTHLVEPTQIPLYRPKLIIFETDHLLWPFWVDYTNVIPPFKKDEHGNVTDQRGLVLKPYPDVPLILKKLKEANHTLAVAARADYREATETLLRYFDLRQFFKYVVIQSCSKRFHFEDLKEQSGVELGDMLFFDPEARNILTAQRVGIPSILCSHGMNLKALDKGLAQFAQLKRKGSL
nr:PREDICTED: magnesium-dependent phosphatase 1-like isoform X2 [Bemisia tabaci]